MPEGGTVTTILPFARPCSQLRGLLPALSPFEVGSLAESAGWQERDLDRPTRRHGRRRRNMWRLVIVIPGMKFSRRHAMAAFGRKQTSIGASVAGVSLQERDELTLHAGYRGAWRQLFLAAA